MKKILVIALLVLAGCAKEDNNKTTTDTGTVLIEPIYQKYVDEFFADAEKFDVVIEDKFIAIKTLDYVVEDENAPALCNRANRTITIRTIWKNSALVYVNNSNTEDDMYKDITLKYLVYREMARCLLGRNTTDNAEEIMYRDLIFSNMYPENADNAIQFLFTLTYPTIDPINLNLN